MKDGRLTMYNKYENQSINRFIFLKDSQIESMKNNSINTLGELSNRSKNELKTIGFDNSDVDTIEVELQRLGMGLRA